jgi:hypothetical protein
MKTKIVKIFRCGGCRTLYQKELSSPVYSKIECPCEKGTTGTLKILVDIIEVKK